MTEQFTNSNNIIVFCACGCGSSFYKYDDRGRPRIFKNNHHMNGERNHRWKGGMSISTKGYRYVQAKGHPRANWHGYVFEHILVMERHIGRFILPDEDVHHINGIRTDNRIENLQLLPHGEHSRLSNKGKPKPRVVK